MSKKTLLNYAIRVERDGYRFYLHLAKAMTEKKLMDLFHLFAEDELRHEVTFRKMVEETVLKTEVTESPISQALQRFLVDMDRLGTKQMEKGMNGELNRDGLLSLAIQLEKDSIIFYSSLKTLIQDDQRMLLEAIIDEEFRHLSRLFAIRQGELDTEISGIDDI